MALSKNIQAIQELVEGIEKENKRLNIENKKLNRLMKMYQSIESIGKVSIIEEMATESAMEPHEWVVMKLTQAIEADELDSKFIAVKPDFYERFERLADARGWSVDSLALSPNVVRWLDQGINNNLL